MSVSILSFVIAQLFCLLIISGISTSKSLESRAQRMASISKALDTGEPLAVQLLSSDFVRASPSSTGDYAIAADGSLDPVREIFRKALAKAPGERLGRLDKQGRFVPDRVVDKRSVYLNLSSIEELLDQEAVGDGSEEPGCYIEIKIIKRIPGRCSTLDGRPVCKTDSYYKNSDECLKTV